MSIGYVSGHRDEIISVASSALREATNSSQGWVLLTSFGGLAEKVAGSRVVFRIDQAARTRTPIGVTDGRDAFPILGEAAETDPRRQRGQRGEAWGDARVIKVSDLVGIALASRRFGVKASTVRKWRERYPDFPSPVASTGRGALYSYAELKAWRQARRGWTRI